MIKIKDKERFSEDTLFLVQEGKDFDMHCLGLKKFIPDYSHYIIMEYMVPQIHGRVLRMLSCQSEHCHKIFCNWHTFIDHMLTHTDDRPFQCSECNQTFKQQGNLRKHLEIHSGVKRFRCEHCNQCFFTGHNLYVSADTN